MPKKRITSEWPGRWEGRDLELVERDMAGIEVGDVDRGRTLGQIAQHVAAARRDGRDAVLRLELHRHQVDIGVFPDLRINEAGEEQAEKALGHSVETESLVLEERALEPLIETEFLLFQRLRHARSPRLRWPGNIAIQRRFHDRRQACPPKRPNGRRTKGKINFCSIASRIRRRSC
jgi:hypothetical protein